MSAQEQPTNNKPSFVRVFLEELSGQPILIPILAVITGLLIGAIIIILTTEEVYSAWAISPWESMKVGWTAVSRAYEALFTGALGSPTRIIRALQGGDNLEIRRAFNPLLESLVAFTLKHKVT